MNDELKGLREMLDKGGYYSRWDNDLEELRIRALAGIDTAVISTSRTKEGVYVLKSRDTQEVVYTGPATNWIEFLREINTICYS